MSEFLKLKKSNCKNCYKCIRHCPVKSIKFSGDQAHIVGNECILCGQCFVVCPQNAKEIQNDLEKVKVMLAAKEQVIVSLAPSFIANYDGIGLEQMAQALRQLGFFAVEETAIGATIVKKQYEAILESKRQNILITSCCHSVNLLIQKYFPSTLRYLADVKSPMQMHAIDIKKRMPNAKVVFIGPCLAKKDEADHYTGIVDAVLTYEELTMWLKESNIVLEKGLEVNEKSKARLFPITGGILKTMKPDIAGYKYIAIDGVENCIAALKDIENGMLDNCVIEMSACVGSCIGGPVMEKYHRSPIRDYCSVVNYAGNQDFDVEAYGDEELTKHFEYIARKAEEPSEDAIRSILRQMGKMRPSDELNCGSCGYNTCREKAIAIIQGKASISMCLPFLKERAEKFYTNIIDNTPDGILVLNEDLEVQQINDAARKIMNIKYATDVLGDQVIRILDPYPFLQVKLNNKNVYNERIYLAEYNRYVERTIVYDKNYKIIICFMRDVTLEVTAKEKKDEISSRTVEIADKVVDKQMRIVQEIASLLGETAAETKIALTKLKESMKDE
ncbi:MAG: 4Fe-4S binding protein [Prevotella sp.]|nr:4Fe-4S binding protein [Staphylococcus sp.]MCM1350456.1 4Fe-4S binding protein [Prevotella sp.]